MVNDGPVMPLDERRALNECLEALGPEVEIPTDPKDIAIQIFQAEALVEVLQARAKQLTEALEEKQASKRRGH